MKKINLRSKFSSVEKIEVIVSPGEVDVGNEQETIKQCLINTIVVINDEASYWWNSMNSSLAATLAAKRGNVKINFQKFD